MVCHRGHSRGPGRGGKGPATSKSASLVKNMNKGNRKDATKCRGKKAAVETERSLTLYGADILRSSQGRRRYRRCRFGLVLPAAPVGQQVSNVTKGTIKEAKARAGTLRKECAAAENQVNECDEWDGREKKKKRKNNARRTRLARWRKKTNQVKGKSAWPRKPGQAGCVWRTGESQQLTARNRARQFQACHCVHGKQGPLAGSA